MLKLRHRKEKIKMAGLRNSNGQIVIDEREAEDTIKKINQAISKLSDARQAIQSSRLDENRMKGGVHDALAEVFSKFNKELNEWESNCNSTIKYLRSVVNHYKKLDREYAAKAGR